MAVPTPATPSKSPTKKKAKTNELSFAALICVGVLLICAFLGLMGVIDIGEGWGIFVLGVGFNGVICAVLSLHYSLRSRSKI